jgi:hypothetical protein
VRQALLAAALLSACAAPGAAPDGASTDPDEAEAGLLFELSGRVLASVVSEAMAAVLQGETWLQADYAAGAFTLSGTVHDRDGWRGEVEVLAGTAAFVGDGYAVDLDLDLGLCERIEDGLSVEGELSLTAHWQNDAEAETAAAAVEGVLRGYVPDWRVGDAAFDADWTAGADGSLALSGQGSIGGVSFGGSAAE